MRIEKLSSPRPVFSLKLLTYTSMLLFRRNRPWKPTRTFTSAIRSSSSWIKMVSFLLNTNSLMDRYYQNVSFVTLKMALRVLNKLWSFFFTYKVTITTLYSFLEAPLILALCACNSKKTATPVFFFFFNLFIYLFFYWIAISISSHLSAKF